MHTQPLGHDRRPARHPVAAYASQDRAGPAGLLTRLGGAFVVPGRALGLPNGLLDAVTGGPNGFQSRTRSAELADKQPVFAFVFEHHAAGPSRARDRPTRQSLRRRREAGRQASLQPRGPGLALAPAVDTADKDKHGAAAELQRASLNCKGVGTIKSKTSSFCAGGVLLFSSTSSCL
ncbi:hypothetical protein ON010_g16379 [Phytophthora cinnamomi]|nr:hypothetical protein ON010_g16379 [Phytophthora cinnamomi]